MQRTWNSLWLVMSLNGMFILSFSSFLGPTWALALWNYNTSEVNALDYAVWKNLADMQYVLLLDYWNILLALWWTMYCSLLSLLCCTAHAAIQSSFTSTSWWLIFTVLFCGYAGLPVASVDALMYMKDKMSNGDATGSPAVQASPVLSKKNDKPKAAVSGERTYFSTGVWSWVMLV